MTHRRQYPNGYRRQYERIAGAAQIYPCPLRKLCDARAVSQCASPETGALVRIVARRVYGGSVTSSKRRIWLS